MEKKLVLISGYGAPGEEDIALYAISGEGAEKRFALCHGRAPSFCCKGTNGMIYAAAEYAEGADITAYALEGEMLRPVRTMRTPGRALCHLYAHGNILFGCCYESGHYFAVDAALTRVLWEFCPPAAHAHWAQVLNERLYLADLGNDCLYQYALSAEGLPAGEAEVLRQPAGSGPRQVLPLPEGGMVCVNELDGTFRVLDGEGQSHFSANASGAAESRNWPGGACLDETGRLYICCRGPNTLSAWERRGGKFAPLWEHPAGNWPRHTAAVPGTGLVLTACTRSNEVLCCAAGAYLPREIARLPLAGASCVLPL